MIFADRRAPYSSIESILLGCWHEQVQIWKLDIVVEDADSSTLRSMELELQRDIGVHGHDPGGRVDRSILYRVSESSPPLEFWSTNPSSDASETSCSREVIGFEAFRSVLDDCLPADEPGFGYMDVPVDTKWGDLLPALRVLREHAKVKVLPVRRAY